MQKVMGVIHRLGQIVTSIVEARVPMSVWLDFAAHDLFRARS
jgi:hypothetical protein